MSDLQPFLRWAGGKRWFVANYPHFFPKKYGRYYEPFLGSGAVFFYLSPKKATLGDINCELINCYQKIKENYHDVCRELLLHQENHSSDYYYNLRNLNGRNLIERAADFIYFNRACFNGIYRVNRNGRFNVPIGDKSNIIRDNEDFERISFYLKRANIYCSDFSIIIGRARKGDFIFADPPYTVRHNKNGFIQYNENLFSWRDQEKLCKSLVKAKTRGALVLLTNANHKSIRELYQDQGFYIKEVSRFSSISANSGSRKQYEELVITSYEV